MSQRASTVHAVGFWNRDKAANNGRKTANPIRMGFGWQIALLLVIGIGLLIGVTYLEWQLLGRPAIGPQITTTPNQLPATTLQPTPSPQPANRLPVDVSLSLLRISLTVVAGIGGIVALVVAYRKQRIGEAQHQREESAARRENQKHYSERFAKASELLGSEQSAVRLAAVYALGSLADDWEAGRQTCIDVLCAYLRMPYKPLTAPPIERIVPRDYREFERDLWMPSIDDQSKLNPSEEQQVRSTIVRVIVEHLNCDADAPWFGQRFNFRGAVMESPDFTDANFCECEVDFEGAFLYGEVMFTGARFENTQFTLDSAVIGGRCSFEVCTIIDSRIDLSCDLISGGGINFSHAEVSGSIIAMFGTKFTDAELAFIGTFIHKGSRVDVGSGEFRNASIAFSRIDIDDASLAVRAGIFDKGDLYLSGLNIGKGGRVTLTGAPQEAINGTFNATNLHLNDVSIKEGFLGIRDQHFINAPLKWSGLKILGGELILTQSQLDEQSPVSFDTSLQDKKSYLTVDICSEANPPVNSSGLEIGAPDRVRVVTRSQMPGNADGTDKPDDPANSDDADNADTSEDAAWSQPQTELAYRNDDEPQPRQPEPWY